MEHPSEWPARPGGANKAFSFGKLPPSLLSKLAKLGLHRDTDLLLHLPLRSEDETRLTAIRDAQSGQAAQFEVTVKHSEVTFRPRRQLVATVQDSSGEMTLRFLNFYPNQQKALHAGARLRLFGEPRVGFFGTEIIHPRFTILPAGSDPEPLPECLTPIYPTTAGLGQASLRGLIQRALAGMPLEDTLPEPIREMLGLTDFASSLKYLHQPPAEVSQAQLESREHPAWRRMAFDELLAQQLSLRRAYSLRRAKGAPRLHGAGQLTEALLAALPFRLTAAQQRVWREIGADLSRPYPMQRLLQGDVGSGKTVVAALAMLQAVECGYQAALMAPTEILAEQHYRKLVDWLTPLGLPIAWLAGSVKKSQRKTWAESLAAGTTQLAVGTHALIEDDIQFAKLGLAIVDEQHRFGVQQRLALKQKEQQHSLVHQLTMSATPIPRTLAMSYYADMDVSVLDQLPPGRTPVVTKLVAENRRYEVIGRVHDACREGRQAYWVCPLIEESEVLQLKTAQETWERLTAELPDLRIGLMHGRLKADEKAAVMAGFASNAIHVLVATTVIEVGVDVPNATLMVIEHAERFGLAQLHQLRGRVGRGSAQSACILLYAAPVGETARARLKAIYENTDGFEIARLDLQLRGPGEFIGARQSGMPLLRFADLEDSGLIEQARATAEHLLADFPDNAEAHMQRWLAGREELLKA